MVILLVLRHYIPTRDWTLVRAAGADPFLAANWLFIATLLLYGSRFSAQYERSLAVPGPSEARAARVSPKGPGRARLCRGGTGRGLKGRLQGAAEWRCRRCDAD